MSVIARTQYDERPVLGSDLDFSNDRGLTKQADAKDADINLLFKRFEKGGQLPDMIMREPRYGDFSKPMDYQNALNIVLMAKEQFFNLSAQLRNEFDNDPYKFLEFVTTAEKGDEEKAQKLEDWGLLKPEAVQRRKDERKKKDIEAGKAFDEAARKRRLDQLKADLAEIGK